MRPDLTPFGFTTTENSAYGALVELGPSSAYAIARKLSIARANAYQALDGLVAKQAAAVVGTGPKRYRAVQPQTLFARVADAQARRLDRLESQMADVATEGERPLVTLSGIRAIRDAATRAILRATGEVRCAGPSKELDALGPAIRARGASGRQVSVWLLGPDASDTEPPLLLVADGALAASGEGASASGYWGADPLFVGLVRATLAALIPSSQPNG
jgi:sugar-specific transcriptional regulator TrmB